MKKQQLFIGLFIVLFLSINTIFSKGSTMHFKNKQEQLIDTVKFLRAHIISKKQLFQHQELNTLINKLSELGLTVKSYRLDADFVRNINKPVSIDFIFDDHKTIQDKNDKDEEVPFLTITFESEVPKKKAFALYAKTFGVWGDEEKLFYSKFLIKDITGMKRHSEFLQK